MISQPAWENALVVTPTAKLRSGVSHEKKFVNQCPWIVYRNVSDSLKFQKMFPKIDLTNFLKKKKKKKSVTCSPMYVINQRFKFNSILSANRDIRNS